METTKSILNRLQEIKPFLQQEFSVAEIGVFGSFADGSFTNESDVDILVEFEKPIGWKFFTLEIFLGNYLGKKIDLVTKNALKSQIKDDILFKTNYI